MIYLTLLIAKSDWCCSMGIYYNSSSDSITKNLINNITESKQISTTEAMVISTISINSTMLTVNAF